MRVPAWEEWESLGREERTQFGLELLGNLPANFKFLGVVNHAFASCSHEIAEYELGSSKFVLIPGGEVALGFDVNRWQPTDDERESWQVTATEYGLDLDPVNYISTMIRRPTTVELPPLLVETKSREIGYESIPLDHPVVARILKNHAGVGTVQAYEVDGVVRVTRKEDGSLTADRTLRLTHADIVKDLNGYRLPTSDEWEYVCGNRAATLYRWGDHVPCDRYPTDTSPAESAWRREWVLSGGTLAYPAEGFQSDWNYHRSPNAFGVCIADNPYHSELTNDPAWVRGGDGGSAICGGSGFLRGWLPLATAYCEECNCQRDPDKPIHPGYSVARRVLDLS